MLKVALTCSVGCTCHLPGVLCPGQSEEFVCYVRARSEVYRFQSLNWRPVQQRLNTCLGLFHLRSWGGGRNGKFR